MNLVYWALIIGVAMGQPNNKPGIAPIAPTAVKGGPIKTATPRPSCIIMSPEKEAQIEVIIEKLSDFLNNITIDHEHFDIRLIKLSIEQHTPHEEEKETMLQLVVNDCELTEEEVEEIEHKEKPVAKPIPDDGEFVAANKAELMYLDIDENGEKLVGALYKNSKKPKLVYVQKDPGQSNYWFLK